MQHNQSQWKLTNAQLFKISKIVTENIDILFKCFSIPYRDGQTKLYMQCMVHDSDNSQSLNIYLDGYEVPFTWKCRSHHCEEIFKKTVIGFTRALLSKNKFGWRHKGDQTVSFQQTLDFLLDLYKIDLKTLEVSENTVDRNQFIAQTSYISRINKQEKYISREIVRGALKIPAQYYIDKGYDSTILDKYDIGLCNNPRKDMYGRIVIPVYNESGTGMIGCTGRSIWPICEKCSLYHQGTCPADQSKYSKWRHNFESRFYLYNYWYALPYLKQSSSAILVESPGNVLKLEMAGIHNSVGLFGSNFTEEQQFLLEKAGVMDITLLMDNDEAGNKGAELIQQKCNRYYNIKPIKIPEQYNDVGEMSVEDIQNLNLKGV